MFAALGLPSMPIVKGEQLCHARNITRVLCPQKSQKVDTMDEEESCEGNIEEDDHSSVSTVEISKRLIQVAVKRDIDGSLGITLCGGAPCDGSSTLSRPLIISNIRPGGPVDREGSIRPGDRLLAVDGHSLEHTTLVEAQALLMRYAHCACWERGDDLECGRRSTPCCSEECCTLLVIEYDVVVRKGLSEARRPFLIKLQMDHPREEVGLSLAMLPEQVLKTYSSQLRPAALVEAVRPASIAERCGALHPGDILLSIGEVLHQENVEAGDTAVNEDSNGGARSSWVLQMEVLPLSQLPQRHSSSRCSDFESEKSKRESQPSANGNFPGEDLLQLEEFLQGADARTSEEGENIWQRGSYQSMNGAIIDRDNEGVIQGGHLDERSVSRTRPLSWVESNGGGLMMRCSSLGESNDPKNVSSSADDQLDSSCFPLLPSNEEKEMEIYTVEVAREGGPLGITLSGTEDPHEYVTISGLVEGGPAKRTCALQIGDRLLAVGGESLVGRPLSEAVALLRSASDPVLLHVARPALSRPGCSQSTEESITKMPLNTHYEVETGSCRPAPLLNLLSSLSVDGAPHLSRDGDETEDTALEHPMSICKYNSNACLQSHHALNRPVSYDSDQQSSLNQGSHSSSGKIGSLGVAESTPQTETLRVTLFKDGIYEDFGFSVSDGLYERGVYVNRIRKGGPADMGSLLPYDRIIQVNDTLTYSFDCCLTVPLIASAGDKIDLIVVRSL